MPVSRRSRGDHGRRRRTLRDLPDIEALEDAGLLVREGVKEDTLALDEGGVEE